MVKILGVEFVPLRVPLERRIQTLCMGQYVMSFLFGGFGCLFLSIYLLFTRFYWISLIYAGWYLLDRKTSETGGNPSSWIRYNVVWRKMGEYFPAKLHKTADLDPRKSYVFGLHPHGIMHISGFLAFATEATGFSELFPGLFPHLAILHGQFQFPFYRDYLLTSGMCSVSRKSFHWMLTHPGHCACVVVGGAMEALESKPGSLKLVLMKRKGFVRQALIHGASLVPVFSFGENDLYEQVDNPEGSFLKRLQLFLTHRVFGFSLPIIRGRGIFNYTFGVFPHRRPLNTVVGAPIDVEKTDEPSQEQIDELHERYVQGLVNVFDSNKTRFGLSEDAKLDFIG